MNCRRRLLLLLLLPKTMILCSGFDVFRRVKSRAFPVKTMCSFSVHRKNIGCFVICLLIGFVYRPTVCVLVSFFPALNSLPLSRALAHVRMYVLLLPSYETKSSFMVFGKFSLSFFPSFAIVSQPVKQHIEHLHFDASYSLSLIHI